MASRLPDLYGVLGVSHDASDDEIKRAYRRLARELHPDVNGDPAAEHRFKEVTAAYETLSDPSRRQRYDTFGRSGMPPDFFPFGDFGDLFEVFFGGTRVGGSAGARSGGPAASADAICSGARPVVRAGRLRPETEVEVQTIVHCGACDGYGAEPGTSLSQCTRCGGRATCRRWAQHLRHGHDRCSVHHL